MGLVYAPKPGFTWNPLRGFPVNALCPCNSGKKFKKCCRNKLPDVIKDDAAAEKLRAAVNGLYK